MGTKDMTTIERLVHEFVFPAIRNGLVAFSGWLAAHNLPGLSDPTVMEVAQLIAAAIILCISWLWSQFEKQERRSGDIGVAAIGSSTRFTAALAAGAMMDSQTIAAIITWIIQYLWSVWEKRERK